MSTITITKPGIYELSEGVYHGDPCPAPSASSSFLKLMLAETPKHAWESHPRLNPNHESSDGEEKFDRGHACHQLMLGGLDRFCVIDADAYRSNDAKAKRAKAYVDGLIPILKHKVPEVIAMCDAGKAQIERMAEKEEREIFTGGKSEQTLVWCEEIYGITIWCRAKLDYFKGAGEIYGDYKSLAASIHPSRLHRYAENADWAMQNAFYERGIRAVVGDDMPDFRFVVQEATKPHRLVIVKSNPATLGIARRKVEHALHQFAWCMRENCWPGFPNTTVVLNASPWAEEQFLAEEIAAKEAGAREHFDAMKAWQAPL